MLTLQGVKLDYSVGVKIGVGTARYEDVLQHSGIILRCIILDN